MTTTAHPASSNIVSRIRSDCLSALKTLKSWSDYPGKPGVPAVVGKPFRAADVAFFARAIKNHCRSLKRVSEYAGDQSKQRSLAAKILLSARDAHICAMLRAFVQCHRYVAPLSLIEFAIKNKEWPVLSEAIVVEWRPKSFPSKGFREIAKSGPLRNGQRLVLRDVLLVSGVDSEIDFTRKGAGGERAFIQKVTKSIEDDHPWWWTPDIKNYFASLRPNHFKWLPVPKQLVMNVAFVPKCTKVRVKLPKDKEKLFAYLTKISPTHPVNTYMQYHSFTVQKTRLGLPEGSTLSPLLARGFVGREIRRSFGNTGIASYSFMDDLAIGACTQKDLTTAKEALSGGLSTNPAGPIELYDADILNANSWKSTDKALTLLGYEIRPGDGFGTDKPTHVKPGSIRIERFKNRLANKLRDVDPKDDIYAVGLEYFERWYDSQTAWTKVPEFTQQVSENIAFCYIVDFDKGIPMGGFKTAKQSQVHFATAKLPKSTA